MLLCEFNNNTIYTVMFSKSEMLIRNLTIIITVIYACAMVGHCSMDKIICYYQSWATYRPGYGKVSIQDIDPNLCTHLIYAFIGLEMTGKIKILDQWNDVELGGFKNFTALKSQNEQLITHVAIGGSMQGSTAFSAMAEYETTRAVFIDNAISFLQQYGFDGLNLDWHYPAQGTGSSPEDKTNFITLLSEMRQKFDRYDLQISAAVAAAQKPSTISYDILAMSHYLDFINLLTYDLHGSWENIIGGNAPLHNGSWETTAAAQELNVDACVKNWLRGGANPEKLILGIGFYGRSFTLASQSGTKPNSPSLGPGNPGPYTKQGGSLAYNEICELLQQQGWSTEMEPEQKFPYSYKGNQWVGYDNPESIKYKMDYAREKGLAGVMVWGIDMDDFHGNCGTPWPLLNTIVNEIGESEFNNTTTQYPEQTLSTSTVEYTSTPTATPPASTPDPKYPNSLCSQPGYIRDPYDCTFFYYCQMYNGAYIAQKFVCYEGLYYNEATNSCDYKENVKECQ